MGRLNLKLLPYEYPVRKNKKNKALSSGLILFAIGSLALLAERLTGWGFSGLIGKQYCGERFLGLIKLITYHGKK